MIISEEGTASSGASIQTVAEDQPLPPAPHLRYWNYTATLCTMIPLVCTIILVACGSHRHRLTHTVPTFIVFALTTPYQFAVGAIACHLEREYRGEASADDRTLPFTPTSKGSIIYSLFLVLLWVLVAVATGFGVLDSARYESSCEGPRCRPLYGGEHERLLIVETVGAAMEVLLLAVFASVCYRRRLQEERAKRPAQPVPLENGSSSGSIYAL